MPPWRLARLSLFLCLIGCATEPVSPAPDEDTTDEEDKPASRTDTGERDARRPDAAARDAGAGDARAATERDAASSNSDAGRTADAGRTTDGGTPRLDASAACPDTAGADDTAALHTAAAEVLTTTSPCGFSSCHTARGKAGLALVGVMDLRTKLVDVPACEAPALALVDGAGGEEALARSWLWLKLTAEVDGTGGLVSEPSWGASSQCGQTGSAQYGALMPLGAELLEEERLAPIRRWICAGAPGPK